jgi:hypothetical protein
MINPFANVKKKGKKSSKTPKSTGTKKKNEVNSEEEAGPDTIDKRTHNSNLIRIEALNNAARGKVMRESVDSEQVV